MVQLKIAHFGFQSRWMKMLILSVVYRTVITKVIFISINVMIQCFLDKSSGDCNHIFITICQIVTPFFPNFKPFSLSTQHLIHWNPIPPPTPMPRNGLVRVNLDTQARMFVLVGWECLLWVCVHSKSSTAGPLLYQAHKCVKQYKHKQILYASLWAALLH